MSFAFSLQLQQAIKQHREKSAHQAGRDNIDPELRSRENIADLFLTGDIPARGNTHRDFLQKRRKLQKMSKMPPVYMAPIPMWNPTTNQREVQSLAFLLPYDRVFAMAKWSNDPVCRQTPAENKHIRLPLTLLKKNFFLKSGETIHVILKALCGSFHACLQNSFPTVDGHGHDHSSNWRRQISVWYVLGDSWEIGYATNRRSGC